MVRPMAGFGSGWLVMVRLTTWGCILAIFELGACGSRTSIVDERYGVGGGTQPTEMPIGGGAGGKANPSPFDPNLATKPCESYCQRYVKSCPQRLDPGQACSASCKRELNSAGSNCQALGTDALRCLEPFYEPSGCPGSLIDGLNACGDRVDAFEQCAGPSESSILPVVDPTKCTMISSGAPGFYCTEEFDCAGAIFSIHCDARGEFKSNPVCHCNNSRGEAEFWLGTANRCNHAAAICMSAKGD